MFQHEGHMQLWSMYPHICVTCNPAGDLMPVKPSPGTAMHQASAHQVLPQHQPADDSTVLPDPVQQQAGVVPQMRQPQTSSQERPQHLRTVPIQPGQPLGSPVLAPSLQPRIATPYNALSGLKVSRPCIPESMDVLTGYQQHKAHMCHLIYASGI